MSIQPLFSGPLFLPSQQLQDAFNIPKSETGQVNINGGRNTGNVFENRGNDFLNPDFIQETTTKFTNSVKPVTTNTNPILQIISPNLLGKNPDSVDILNGTFKAIRIATDPNITDGVARGVNSDPFDWKNPTALDIYLGTLFSSLNVAGLPPSVTSRIDATGAIIAQSGTQSTSPLPIVPSVVGNFPIQNNTGNPGFPQNPSPFPDNNGNPGNFFPGGFTPSFPIYNGMPFFPISQPVFGQLPQFPQQGQLPVVSQMPTIPLGYSFFQSFDPSSSSSLSQANSLNQANQPFQMQSFNPFSLQ